MYLEWMNDFMMIHEISQVRSYLIRKYIYGHQQIPNDNNNNDNNNNHYLRFIKKFNIYFSIEKYRSKLQ